MSRRNWVLIAGLAGVALIAVACGGAAAPTATKAPAATATTAPAATRPPAATPTQAPRAKAGGTVTAIHGTAAQPDQLYPHIYYPTNNDVFLENVHSYLVYQGVDGTYDPSLSLAEWKFLDDLTIQFRLKPGALFSDGEKADANAVKVNFDRIAVVKPSPRKYVIDSFTSYAVMDAMTVQVKLKAVQAGILGELAHPGMAIMSPASLTKFTNDELNQGKGAGAGAFVLTLQLPDDRVELERNRNYWRKDAQGAQLPYVDKVVFRVVPEATVRLGMLKAGQADVLRDPLPKDVETIQNEAGLRTVRGPGGIIGAYWNLSRPPFTDLKFRQALAWAIDREAICKIAYLGNCIPGVSAVLPNTGWAFDAKLDVPKYDPTKAKAFLAQSAITSKAFSMNCDPAPTATKVCEMLQSFYDNVGIKMTIKPERTASNSELMWATKKIDSFFAGYSATPDPYSKMYTAHHLGGYYTPEGDKLEEFDTPEKLYARVNKYIDDSNLTYDLKERARLMNEAAKIIANENQFLVIGYSVFNVGVRDRVKDLRLGPLGKERYGDMWLDTR